MLDKIYQVVEVKLVSNGEDVVITDTFGCFPSVEEAQKFVKEFLLKYIDEKFELNERSDGRVWNFGDRAIAINGEPVGFDKSVEEFRILYTDDI